VGVIEPAVGVGRATLICTSKTVLVRRGIERLSARRIRSMTPNTEAHLIAKKEPGASRALSLQVTEPETIRS
jgi:hypothetical protein